MKKKNLFFLLLAVAAAVVLAACQPMTTEEAEESPYSRGNFAEEVIWMEEGFGAPYRSFSSAQYVTLVKMTIPKLGIQMYCLVTEAYTQGGEYSFDRECWPVEPAE